MLVEAGTRSRVDFTGALVDAIASFSTRLGFAGRFREPINFDLLVAPVATPQKSRKREKDDGRSRYRTHAAIRIGLGDRNRANALDNCYDRQRSHPGS